MSTSDPSQLDDLSATEELTAYLDGEVDAEHARRIEERLARDEGYRRQLQGLQRTWDMLDQLREKIWGRYSHQLQDLLAEQKSYQVVDDAEAGSSDIDF